MCILVCEPLAHEYSLKPPRLQRRSPIYQEAAIYDDAKDHHQQDNAKEHHQEEDDANVHHQEEEDDAKDHHRQEDPHSDIECQETDNILEHTIEYLIEGAYPLGLTKDKKRAVRKKAQTISIEKGEVYIKRKKNKVGLSENYIRW